MSFIPAFEIGVWNTWIFMVAWVLFHMIPLDWPIFRYNLKAMMKKGSASPPYTRNEKILNNLGTLIWFALLIYSIFLPLPLGTPLLHAGIALFVVGLVIFERHPIYIGVFLQYLGIGIASASGLFLLLIIIQITLSVPTVPAEERFCLNKYGEAYREYMERTPRWIGVPK